MQRQIETCLGGPAQAHLLLELRWSGSGSLIVRIEVVRLRLTYC